jgi:hypothetical protein
MLTLHPDYSTTRFSSRSAYIVADRTGFDARRRIAVPVLLIKRRN